MQIGSYPDWFNNYFKVKVTVESANEHATKAAVMELHQNLPKACLLGKVCSISNSKSFVNRIHAHTLIKFVI